MKIASSSKALLHCLAILTLSLAMGSAVSPNAWSGENHDFSGKLESKEKFHIQAQPLDSALHLFSSQGNLQVSVDSKWTAGKESNVVSGEYTIQQALNKLLMGTGLHYSFVDSNTVTLEPVAEHTLTLEVQSKELKVIKPERFAEKEKARDDEKATRLPPVAVEGVNPLEPKGYTQENTPTATKTNTPLIEIPQSVSMITRQRMTDQNVQSLAEVLSYTSGVQSSVFGVDTRADWFNLRGFPSNFTSLYKDGLKLSFPSGNLHVRTEPYGLERVDVFKGPSSVLYGQNTPGGMVNLVSKKPPMQSGHQLALTFGSFDRKQVMLDTGGPIEGAEEFQYRLTAMARDSDTQVDFVEDNRFFVAPSLSWRPNDRTSLTLLTHLHEDDTGNVVNFYPLEGTILPNPFGEIPTSRFTGEPNFDQYEKTQASVGYQFEHEVNNALKVRQNFRYYYIDYTWKQVFASGLQADNRTLNRFLVFEKVNADSFTVDTHVQYDFATGPLQHKLLAGVDQLTQRIDVSTATPGAPTLDVFSPVYNQTLINDPAFSSITDVIQHQTGVYLQDQIKWNRWILVLSGRHDWASSETDNIISGTTTKQRDAAFTGRVGLVYRSKFGLAPYVSYSESFNPALGTNLFGQAFIPEEGKQIEVGVKYEPENVDAQVTLSVFDLRRQNVQNPDPSNPFNTIQTGEVRSQGIEVESNISLMQGLDMVAAYTYLDMEVTKTTFPGEQGNRPTQVPEHIASLWANYTVQNGPLAGLGTGGGVRYQGTSFADFANTIKVPSYVIFDAALRYRWSHWDMALNVQNVADKTYAAGCFSSACFYGARRNVMGTVRYNW
ncbi:TonB-dependent siderophore receptor [Nitrospina watsonii]|uniref:TonB-dependent siderophore receptor n=1 Tax=Nitrospina watsonii TaxID=1323948 RepID=A0ABN8VZL0_9BACT|nr:TonB-dependent siderophore receptor [Nitrospina watsonii]CAI2717593.1 TonB-dependent siderophore receptor [Nitrospina watsonii]